MDKFDISKIVCQASKEMCPFRCRPRWSRLIARVTASCLRIGELNRAHNTSPRGHKRREFSGLWAAAIKCKEARKIKQRLKTVLFVYLHTEPLASSLDIQTRNITSWNELIKEDLLLKFRERIAWCIRKRGRTSTARNIAFLQVDVWSNLVMLKWNKTRRQRKVQNGSVVVILPWNKCCTKHWKCHIGACVIYNTI